jgi:DNA-binding winged helix-turn-helix (wHTH) protein
MSPTIHNPSQDNGDGSQRTGARVPMHENPFFHRGPIRDPDYFYGRQAETRHALRMLLNGQSVSVIGPRKIGKTSFLFHLCRSDVLREHGLDPARTLFVYVNCEDLGHLGQQALYALLAGEIAEQAAQCGQDIALPERPASHLEFERAIAGLFERDLALVLVFDEFELLSRNKSLNMAFFSGLRALATRFGLAYLTASRRPLLGLPQDVDYSPFFNIFFPVKLGLFDEGTSRALIAGYLAQAEASLPPAVVDRVLVLGGGHPFFMQVAAYWALELQEAKGSSLQERDLGLLEHSVRGQVESHLNYYWTKLSDRERYVLAVLAFTQDEDQYRQELDALASDCLVVNRTMWPERTPIPRDSSRGEQKECTPDLQTQEGLRLGGPLPTAPMRDPVLMGPMRGTYRYFSPLFRDFVRRQEVGGLLQAGPFVLDVANQRALHREASLSLSTSQYALLAYLIERHGQVIASQELDREVLATPGEMYEYLTDERLKSAIKGLRRSLGEDAACIENKRGIGYVFRVPPSSD